MKVFKELKITGPSAELAALLDNLAQSLPPGWRQDMENAHPISGNSPARSYAFTRAETETEPESHLHLLLVGKEISLVNVCPTRTSGKWELSVDQYNRIVNDFVQTVIGPRVAAASLTMEQTEGEADITHWITPKAAQLLRRFALHANKGTGSKPPSDFALWAKFLIQVHRDRSSFRPELLKRWLIEELGWPEEMTRGLLQEYEFAQRLLEDYDAAA
jgi:hypothetical protein